MHNEAKSISWECIQEIHPRLVAAWLITTRVGVLIYPMSYGSRDEQLVGSFGPDAGLISIWPDNAKPETMHQ